MNQSMRWLRGWGFCYAILAFALCGARAESAAIELPKQVQEVLDGYVSAGVEIVDTFEAPGGLIGVAAKARQQGLILYLDRQGEYLFMGMMLGARGGVNHTEALLEKYFPDQYVSENTTPPASLGSAADAVITPQELAAIPSINYSDFEGEPLSHLYVFVDFACNHCLSLYDRLRSEELRAVLAERRIALAVLPVAFSGEQTAFKAGYALARHPSSEELRALFGRDAPLPTDISKDDIGSGAMSLARVMNAARAHGISSVPILFLVRDGAVRVGSGSPDSSSLLDFLAPPAQP